MIRVHTVVAATLITTMFAGAGAALSAQTELKPILAGRKIVPPVKGEAQVEFVQPVTKANQAKGVVQTTIKVKNASPAPIARLMVVETWYDAGGAVIASSRGFINGLLQPDETQTVLVETPINQKMKSNNWNFSHANGTVKVTKVKSLDEPAAAKTAPAGKK